MTTMTAGDLAMIVVENGSIKFTDFEPRNVPGYTSDIATAVGCSEEETESLLRAYDALRDDHHYSDHRRVVRPKTVDREVRPAEISVTFSLA